MSGLDINLCTIDFDGTMNHTVFNHTPQYVQSMAEQYHQLAKFCEEDGHPDVAKHLHACALWFDKMVPLVAHMQELQSRGLAR